MPAYQNPQRHAASLRCIRNRLRVRRYRTPDTQNNKGLPGESVTATFFYICHTTVGINACKTFGNGMYHETKHRVLNIVVSLLLLSSVIHTGCMYAIASNNGGVKPYDLNVQKKGAESAGGSIFKDAPAAQATLPGNSANIPVRKERQSQYSRKNGTRN